jgi:hypothetical protein
MGELRFTDGIVINTSGNELKPLELADGWYVVGIGMLLPVKDKAEALYTIKELDDSLKKGIIWP